MMRTWFKKIKLTPFERQACLTGTLVVLLGTLLLIALNWGALLYSVLLSIVLGGAVIAVVSTGALLKEEQFQSHFEFSIPFDTETKRLPLMDPDHEGAYKALGYEKYEGKWLTGDELMAARGFVRHEGRWLKREAVEKMLEDAKHIRIERERQATAERIARMQREVELAKIEVERERIEKEKLEAERRWRVCLPVRWPCGDTEPRPFPVVPCPP
jgi:hypothetical protein